MRPIAEQCRHEQMSHVCGSGHLFCKLAARLLQLTQSCPIRGCGSQLTPVRQSASSIWNAAKTGDNGAFNFYLSNGVSLETALEAAAGAGNTEVCRELLNRGARLNKRGDGTDKGPSKPFIAAARGGHLPTLELLRESGAIFHGIPSASDPSRIENSPMHSAVYGRQPIVIPYLAQLGIDVDIFRPHKDADGTGGPTPLFCCAGENKRVECARVLLELGADPNRPIRTSSNHTPVVRAALLGTSTVFAVMLEYGGNPSCCGHAALHEIAKRYLNPDKVAEMVTAIAVHCDDECKNEMWRCLSNVAGKFKDINTLERILKVEQH